MKKIFMSVLLLVGGIAMSFAQLSEGLTEYKLDNGLTVYLWEDHDQPDVFGATVTRAGSIDEPETATGLAHYLEHMLFKGTEKIGALDWEKEKPAIFLIALLCVYVGLILVVGFIPASIITFFIVLAYCGERKPFIYIVIAAATVGIYFLFKYVFTVSLPTGIFF